MATCQILPGMAAGEQTGVELCKWIGRVMIRLAPDLVDVALGRKASQSSISQWSQPDEAANPVSGIAYPDFAFHTDVEDNPWWLLDLGAVLPIETIVVHNRVRMLQERAARLRVEIAEICGKWRLVHAGYARFGGGDNGTPLLLNVGSDLLARYIRVSIDDRQHLHLSKVEVFARHGVIALSKFCKIHKLAVPTQGPDAPYKLTKHSRSQVDKLIGIEISNSRRLGNILIQYINSIQLAERTGLKYVKLGHHYLFDAKSTFSVNDIHFIPPMDELPPEGIFLSGEFFTSGQFVPVLSPSLSYSRHEEADISRICQTYILPHILKGLPAPSEQKLAEELTIHLRAGDIFDCDDSVTSGYRQPPLSFYIFIVEQMRSAGRIDKVRLVFEDRGNPCVDALEAWLRTHEIACRIQSASLFEDLSALVDASHLVFGHGTFGYAACRLSKHIKTVHFFAPQLGGRYEFMPNLDEVYSVTDNGEYIKAYEYDKPFGVDDAWRRTPEMYDKMLTYPKSALSIQRLR